MSQQEIINELIKSPEFALLLKNMSVKDESKMSLGDMKRKQVVEKAEKDKIAREQRRKDFLQFMEVESVSVYHSLLSDVLRHDFASEAINKQNIRRPEHWEDVCTDEDVKYYAEYYADQLRQDGFYVKIERKETSATEPYVKYTLRFSLTDE